MTAELKQTRASYLQHVTKMLTHAGRQECRAAKRATFWRSRPRSPKCSGPRSQNRDPVKTYNKVAFAKLPALAPGYNWSAYLSESGVKGKVDYLIVSQPSYITGFNRLLQQTPLPIWKAYFRFRVLIGVCALPEQGLRR